MKYLRNYLSSGPGLQPFESEGVIAGLRSQPSVNNYAPPHKTFQHADGNQVVPVEPDKIRIGDLFRNKARVNRFFVFCVSIIIFAGSASAQPVLDEYIRQGLTNNLVLKEKNITLEKSLIALKEARSYFLPTSWFDGQYTLANGGRTIEFPVGDLLNPVYQTLNQLTGSSKFPQVQNVSMQFLPNNFYDVRFKTTMPVINTDLRYNRNIREQETHLRENEIEIYRRDLVKEIKQAYYTILMADKAIGIYSSAQDVVRENLRTNQSLLANGKGLPAYVSRSESELKQVESQLENSLNEKQKAIAWFNSLLNRELTDSVTLADIPLADATATALRDYNDNVNSREELKYLSLAKDIRYNVLKMNKSFRTPKLNAFLDLAAQDYSFKVKQNSFFYLGGLQLTVPIYAGNRNTYKIQQSELDIKSIELTEKNTRKQLELSAFNSRTNARNNYNNYLSAAKQEEAAQQYFKLIDRGYREGVNSFIEMLDARNQLTQSQLQKELNRYRLLAALADYERQTSSYSFKP